jgi:hypothetical protein
VPVKHLDDLREIHQGSREPVDLVDHHNVDGAGLHLGEELLEARPLDRAPGITPVVIGGGQHPPALVLLARDIGLAGLALGMQRVETCSSPSSLDLRV